jgi:hypothetical protein
VGLEQGPLSLVTTIEELLGRKSSGSGLEMREYGRRDLSRRPRDTLYLQRLVLASSISGGRSVDVVRGFRLRRLFFRSHWIGYGLGTVMLSCRCA